MSRRQAYANLHHARAETANNFSIKVEQYSMAPCFNITYLICCKIIFKPKAAKVTSLKYDPIYCPMECAMIKFL